MAAVKRADAGVHVGSCQAGGAAPWCGSAPRASRRRASRTARAPRGRAAPLPRAPSTARRQLQLGREGTRRRRESPPRRAALTEGRKAPSVAAGVRRARAWVRCRAWPWRACTTQRAAAWGQLPEFGPTLGWRRGSPNFSRNRGPRPEHCNGDSILKSCNWQETSTGHNYTFLRKYDIFLLGNISHYQKTGCDIFPMSRNVSHFLRNVSL